jgi:hypothetical protein
MVVLTTPESSGSIAAVAHLPEEVRAFLAETPTGVDYLSFNEKGEVELPTKFRISIPGVDHDFGRCRLAKNPKITYDETFEVLDDEGNIVRTGEFVFEVIPHNKRSLNTGTVFEEVDEATMTKVVKPVFKNENRVMVVASYATPIPRCIKLPFPIDEIQADLALRKSSERRTGKIKPTGKAKRGQLAATDLDNGSHVGWLATGEIFRLGNPQPEIVIPESPQRAALMAAFADQFYDAPPTAEEVAEFKSANKLA